MSLPDDLFYLLEAHNDIDLSDASWIGVLKDAVYLYNKENYTEFDVDDTVIEYIKIKNKET
jgi:hypothetical protein